MTYGCVLYFRLSYNKLIMCCNFIRLDETLYLNKNGDIGSSIKKQQASGKKR